MFLLFIVVLFWGLSWYAIVLQLGDVHPLVSVSWRFLIAGIVLCVYLITRKQLFLPKSKDLPRILALGLSLFCFNFISFYFATGYLTSGLISVVFAMAVFITVLNQWIWARIVPEGKTLVGAGFGVIGIALLFAPSIADNLGSGNNNILMGLGLSLLGTWFFSIGNLASASLSRTAHLPSTIVFAMIIGACVSGLLGLLLGETLALPWQNLTYLAALAYLALGASVIAFVAYLTLVDKQGPAKAGYATALFPIVALAVSTYLEGYQWSLMSATGAVLAILGAIIVFYKKPTANSLEQKNR